MKDKLTENIEEEIEDTTKLEKNNKGKNKEAINTAKECYNNIQNFIGIYYPAYKSPTKLWIIRGIAIAIFLVIAFAFIPWIMKSTSNLWIALFLLVWDTAFLIIIITHFKNVRINIFCYFDDGKPMFVYWDKNCKKYFIVNFGQKKKFKFVKKHNVWIKNNEKLAPDKFYFEKIRGNAKIEKSENNVTNIIVCNNTKNPNKVTTKLAIKDNMPLYISTEDRRIDFTEINIDKYIEIPKSFLDFCKKEKITPPEENNFLHYTDIK